MHERRSHVTCPLARPQHTQRRPAHATPPPGSRHVPHRRPTLHPRVRRPRPRTTPVPGVSTPHPAHATDECMNLTPRPHPAHATPPPPSDPPPPRAASTPANDARARRVHAPPSSRHAPTRLTPRPHRRPTPASTSRPPPCPPPCPRPRLTPRHHATPGVHTRERPRLACARPPPRAASTPANDARARERLACPRPTAVRPRRPRRVHRRIHAPTQLTPRPYPAHATPPPPSDPGVHVPSTAVSPRKATIMHYGWPRA
ncbi:hypothetical protein GGX14DRAFT_557732 [Mycena pura]|uniref:Uncharacterized protein n=1 Tax=Mycena pura TaxID=153505 RepID=A0AAD7E0V0_9AGAR|nr:hypothetical protein GGX14DRAFT_557732 [Mycena pura]